MISITVKTMAETDYFDTKNKKGYYDNIISRIPWVRAFIDSIPLMPLYVQTFGNMIHPDLP